jgi:hypothetical protein
MNEPWFDPNQYSWIPGTVLGVFGGLLGGVAGVLAPKGRAKGFVLGLWVVSLAASALLLIAGIVALAFGQPYGVWYGLLLPGVLGLSVLGGLLRVVVQRYQEAERRRLLGR